MLQDSYTLNIGKEPINKKPRYLLADQSSEIAGLISKMLHNNLAQPTLADYTQATTTPALVQALYSFDNSVNRTPKPITPEMGHYEAQANRILWERWEAAAIALFNLRNDIANVTVNRVWIDRLVQRFPKIDLLFPSSYFEPEYDEDAFVEVAH